MDGGFQYYDIVFLGILAGFVLYRLSAVLGRKTGHERPRYNPFGGGKAEGADDKIVSLPKPQSLPKRAAGEDELANILPKGSPVAGALTEIQIADRSFELAGFLSGARVAYEMIVTAFAKGDRRTLKPLLNEDVYKSFDEAIGARENRGETIESHFIGIKSAELTGAALKDRVAELTVRFVCEVISYTKNADGAVIEGDPTAVHEIQDLWTFARNVRASDPNWKLISTHPA